MFDWLASFFAGFTSIFGLSGLVRNALIKVTNTLLSLFKGWVVGGVNFAYWLRLWVNRVWRFALGVLAVLEHILFAVIPTAVVEAFNRARTWAAQEINNARNILSNWISRVESFAHTELGKLTNLVTGWIAAVKTDVGNLWARFIAVEHRVINLLTKPDALADWLVGAMVSAIGRYALGQSVRWARWLLPRAIPLTRWAVDQAERIFVEMFL